MAEPAPGPGDAAPPGTGALRGLLRPGADVAVLLAAATTPALPGLVAPLALALLAVAWFALRPPPREAAVVGLGVLVALVALVVGWRTAGGLDLTDADWRAATRRSYAALWQALETDAGEARRALAEAGAEQPAGDEEARLAAFRTLADLVAEGRPGRQALLLVDPDGEPVAWAGEGLLHELGPAEIPRTGPTFEASFGAVTSLVVEPLDDARRPWRVVAARSFSTDRLPFGPGSGWLPGFRLRWSLVASEEAAAPGADVLAVDGAPSLVVERGSVGGGDRHPTARAAWAALAAVLLLLASMRGVGLALLPAGSGRVPRLWAVALLALAGALAGALAAGAGAAPVAALAGGLALAVGGLSVAPVVRRRVGRDGRAVAAAAGAAAVVLLGGAAWLTQVEVGPSELAARMFTPPSVLVLRLALAAAAVGLFSVAGSALGRHGGAGEREGEGGPRGERWAWLAAPPLLAGAAACDHPLVGVPLLVLAGVLLALWVGERAPRRATGLTVLVLLAALLSAAVWETSHRGLVRRELAERTLPRLGAPTAEEREALARQVDGFFSGADLADFVPRSPAGLGREDLAYLLWQGSPLGRLNALSRLTVFPFEGPPSSFSFGIPAPGPDGALPPPRQWQDPPPVPVEGRLVEGTSGLEQAGEPWAWVEWSLLPAPGFRLEPGGALDDVEVALLRGLAGSPALSGLPESALYVYYGADGRPLTSPWREHPSLAEELAGEERRVAEVETPAGGPAWAVSVPQPDGWAVIYLPRLSPLDALERVGTHALGVLGVLLAVALLALLVALPRAGFRRVVQRTVRSYSRRLLLVYTLLLLVPLLLLNVVLVATVQERLRKEQRAAGEAALASAQQVVGDYLVSLEPGFDLASELDDSLVQWLSRVLHHELILYWGSELWASSKPELFTARLLPKRIPGESFSRLAVLDRDLAARTNRVGDVSYLELYAPLRIPGEESGSPNFFLSVPLLAQQEAVARELTTLRRQALLFTALLVVLVTAVGVRLSRSFTRPLTELVEGTRRIAAGARSLDLAPSELELAALVEAVDDMARRIAEGRERLLREKQVVERMVEHVTSGVVSVDREGRVLLRNRVAGELLGVSVGDRLGDTLRRRPRLVPVADWLQSADREIVQRTVRLPPAAEPDEGGPEPAPGDGGGGEAGETAPGDGDEPERPPADDGEPDGRGSGSARPGDAAGGDGGGSGAEEGAGGGEREWTLVWVPVPGVGEPAALLVVEDVTETLRTQRLEAWAEMARIIAHEIKNPLTPIRLNIEHVQQVWRDEGRVGEEDRRFAEVLARCTDNVLAQVDELRQIASEFSAYSRIPRTEPRRGDLVEALRELAEPYRSAPPPGVELAVETEPEHLEARFDRRLLARAVRNLLENALRASGDGGRVVLRLERRPAPAERGGPAAAEARISVLDSGPGIDPELLPRIFDPYFSTHDTGTGLGLPIARRIAEEHGGTIAARNRAEGGLEVTITLPVVPGA